MNASLAFGTGLGTAALGTFQRRYTQVIMLTYDEITSELIEDPVDVYFREGIRLQISHLVAAAARYTYMHVHTHACAYLHTHTHTHTHTHMSCIYAQVAAAARWVQCLRGMPLLDVAHYSFFRRCAVAFARLRVRAGGRVCVLVRSTYSIQPRAS